MEKSLRSKLKKNATRIVLVLNILAALGLWLCCISTWFNPASWPHFTLLGLLFPVFLIIDLAFTLIWLLVNYKRAWIPLATIVPVLGFVFDYFPISFSKEVPDGSIKLLTWNTHHYGTDCENKEEGRNLTKDYIKESKADIVCLQESGISDELIKDLTEYLKEQGYEQDKDYGTMIFTRFPIVDSDTISYDTNRQNGIKGNSSKWYKLLVGKDTVVLVNNHLESNHLREEIKNKYVETLDKPEYEGIKESGHNIGSRLVKSTAYRAQQADTLVSLVKRFEGMPIILCGDFNDTPISYTYQRVNSVLKSAYRESGNGIGISYNQRGFWVRIDHIFVSDHWQTYNTHIDNSIRVSDHYPLVSWLKMR